MSCQDYEALIGDYVDGDDGRGPAGLVRVAPVDVRLVPGSRRRLQRDSRREPLTLEAQVPPPHVWRKLSAAIEAEPKPFFGLGGAYWWRALAPAAAMVVLVVALSWTAAG